MRRINIGGMDAYETLRRHARERRDRDIQTARDRFAESIDQIYKLQARNGHGGLASAFYNRDIRFFAADVLFSKLTLIAAAERVLMEGKALRIAELVIELQRRGVRAGADPRTLSKSIRSALRYHRTRFFKDKSHRWSVI